MARTRGAADSPEDAPPRRGTSGSAVAGILLTLGIALVLELLYPTPLRITAPGVPFVLAVAFATYRGGLRAGVISAVLASAYIYHESTKTDATALWFASPLGRVALVGGTMIGVAALVGHLHHRLQRTVAGERAQRDVAEERERLLIGVLESMGEGFISFDTGWRVRYVNARGALMLGRSRDALVGQEIWGLFPAAKLSPAYAALRRAMDERVHVELQAEYEPSGRWFELRADPGDTGLTVFFRDVTASRRASSFAELSQRLLAESGAALAASLDVPSMVSALGTVVVPAFADALVPTLSDEGGALRRLPAIVHGDAAALTAALPPGDETLAIVLEVAAGGGSIRVGGNDAAANERHARSALARLLDEIGYGDALVVALAAGGRTRGALLFLSRRPATFGSDEVRLAEELAHRTGFAIDNVRLYESAMLANQAKSDFLAVMSHELRTPLTTVMGYTDLLLSGLPEPLSPPAQRYVERMRMAAWHLLAIIEQILIYTRLEVGTEVLHANRASVRDVLYDAAALIEPVAREKGIAFDVRYPTESISIETDLTKLRQILLNLLSNAIRFTDEGYVALAAQADGHAVLFRVEDTGIGVEPEHVERIFEPFWQVDQSATRRVGGTGLGLSVARRLARLLGGDVTCESAPGHGARFTLRLPARWTLP